MSKTFSLEDLTADIRDRHMGSESRRLVEKWTRTGLLRGMNGVNRENMARLLENQAADLIRESSSLSTGGGALADSGQIRGFSNIAFPIVRRVFGGLVANELVSIQPMSLPSGLLFYLDYTYGTNVGGSYGPDGTDGGSGLTDSVYSQGDSIYNNPTGKGVRSGSLATGGMYDLVGQGYTKVHSGAAGVEVKNVGTFGSDGVLDLGEIVDAVGEMTGATGVAVMFDPQLEAKLDDGSLVGFTLVHVSVADITGAVPGADLLAVEQVSLSNLSGEHEAAAWGEEYQGGSGVMNLRRLNRRGNLVSGRFTADPLNGSHVEMVVRLTGSAPRAPGETTTAQLSVALTDSLEADSTDASSITIPSFESDFSTGTPSANIPEIDIKVESIAVTATTRKLRARWSPELAQDLNAYHSLDAEVELTQILSEQVALEIDREILYDLLSQANGANLFWSRAPGRFVNKETGTEETLSSTLAAGPAFTGTVREWYETLIETVIDVANTIHRKTLRGSANFVVTSPDVSTIIEASLAYKPALSIDGMGQVGAPFSIGAEKVGTLSNRFTVYKDPYFPRNKLLVGFKGGSYLETGYVYAPYVPLIVTPTIFAPEDFTPRKGVMTRYGKKMVRSDFYGTVTVLDLNII